MKSGNPVLQDKYLQSFDQSHAPMTLSGTVNKTLLLLALVLISTFWMWARFNEAAEPAEVMPWMWGGMIAGLLLALIGMRAQRFVHLVAPAYALAQGLVIGGISAMYEKEFPGIVMQAVGLTFGTLFAMLMLFRTGAIKVTEKFRSGIMAAMGGIVVVYLIDIVMGFFGRRIGFVHEGGTFGIVFSVFVVGIAALNLVLDFDFIQRGIEQKAPRQMEWYGAFGLTVTLIWLYLEILRLLSKARR